MPDLKYRYLAEDVPTGLCFTRGLAELLEVPTPTIDKAGMGHVIFGKGEWKEIEVGGTNGEIVGKIRTRRCILLMGCACFSHQPLNEMSSIL